MQQQLNEGVGQLLSDVDLAKGEIEKIVEGLYAKYPGFQFLGSVEAVAIQTVGEPDRWIPRVTFGLGYEV